MTVYFIGAGPGAAGAFAGEVGIGSPFANATERREGRAP